jgi:hypothetical protein
MYATPISLVAGGAAFSSCSLTWRYKYDQTETFVLLSSSIWATRRCNPPSTHAAMTDGASPCVCYPHFVGGRRRGVFELLADMALQIRPDNDLRLDFIFNLSHSVMQSTKYSRRNDWRSEYCSVMKNLIVVRWEVVRNCERFARRILRRFLHTLVVILFEGLFVP